MVCYTWGNFNWWNWGGQNATDAALPEAHRVKDGTARKGIGP